MFRKSSGRPWNLQGTRKNRQWKQWRIMIMNEGKNNDYQYEFGSLGIFQADSMRYYMHKLNSKGESFMRYSSRGKGREGKWSKDLLREAGCASTTAIATPSPSGLTKQDNNVDINCIIMERPSGVIAGWITGQKQLRAGFIHNALVRSRCCPSPVSDKWTRERANNFNRMTLVSSFTIYLSPYFLYMLSLSHEIHQRSDMCSSSTE